MSTRKVLEIQWAAHESVDETDSTTVVAEVNGEGKLRIYFDPPMDGCFYDDLQAVLDYVDSKEYEVTGTEL